MARQNKNLNPSNYSKKYHDLRKSQIIPIILSLVRNNEENFNKLYKKEDLFAYYEVLFKNQVLFKSSYEFYQYIIHNKKIFKYYNIIIIDESWPQKKLNQLKIERIKRN